LAASRSEERCNTPHHPRGMLATTFARFRVPGYTGLKRRLDAYFTR
jgi:hypothetical protein